MSNGKTEHGSVAAEDANAERKEAALTQLCNPDRSVRQKIIEEYMEDSDLHTPESRAVLARFEEVSAFRSILWKRTRSWLNTVWISRDLLVNVEGDVDLSGFTGPALPFAFGEVGSFNAAGKGLTTLKGVPRRVKGNLDISSNPFESVEAWPESIQGTTMMRHCPNVRTLPDELRASNLSISRCPSLVSMGKNMSITGHLWLEDCPALRSPPEKLTVEGELHISGCPLTHLTPGLTVGDDLTLKDCPELQALPDGLTVNGKLTVTGCKALTSVGTGSTIKGDFELEDCPALSAIPADLRVGGVLRFTRCSSLQSLPEGLSCGSIEVHFCEQLATLPKTLPSLTALRMLHGTALCSLPEHIRGTVHLEACPELESFSNVSVIDGDLIIEDAPSLTSLPRTLTRVANLELRDCPKLTELPPQLTIDGDLTLVNCPALESLPPGLEVGGERKVAERVPAPDDPPEESSEESCEEEDEASVLVSSASFEEVRNTLTGALRGLLQPASPSSGKDRGLFAHRVDAIRSAFEQLKSDFENVVEEFEAQAGAMDHQKSVESIVGHWATRPAGNPHGSSPARNLKLGEKRELLRLLKQTRILSMSEKTDTHEYGSDWDGYCSFSIGDFRANSHWMYERHADGELEQEKLCISPDAGDFSLEETRKVLKTSLSLETLAIFLRFVAFRQQTPGEHSRFEGEKWETEIDENWLSTL